MNDANRALAAAQEPITRLNAITTGLATAEAELARCRQGDDAQLGAWLGGGGEGRRPEPSIATLDAERRLAALVRDGAGARAILPERQRVYQGAVEAVRRLQADRDGARWRVAAEAAEAFATSTYREAIVAMLRAEATLAGLRDELAAAGHANEGTPGALRAMEAITRLMVTTRRSIEIPVDPGRGRRLLAALNSSADAAL